MTERIRISNFIFLLKEWAKPLGVTIPEAAWDQGYNVMHGERELCHIEQDRMMDQVWLQFRDKGQVHPVESGMHDEQMFAEAQEWITLMLETR